MSFERIWIPGTADIPPDVVSMPYTCRNAQCMTCRRQIIVGFTHPELDPGPIIELCFFCLEDRKA